MPKIPQTLIPYTQVNAIKVVLTATVAVWIGAQKSPEEAADALRATTNGLVSNLPLGDVPAEHKEAFVESLRSVAIGIVDTAASSWDMESPGTRQ